VGYIVFLGVVIGGVLAVLGLTRVTRGKGPVTPLVLLAKPIGETEAELILQRLRSEGIWARAQDTVPPRYPYGYPITYSAEIWVKEKDYDRAKRLIGVR
jgi:hypothetical protein